MTRSRPCSMKMRLASMMSSSPRARGSRLAATSKTSLSCQASSRPRGRTDADGPLTLHPLQSPEFRVSTALAPRMKPWRPPSASAGTSTTQEARSRSSWSKPRAPRGPRPKQSRRGFMATTNAMLLRRQRSAMARGGSRAHTIPVETPTIIDTLGCSFARARREKSAP